MLYNANPNPAKHDMALKFCHYSTVKCLNVTAKNIKENALADLQYNATGNRTYHTW